MNVALIIEHMDPARGGRETSTAQIAVQLAARGCEVTVLCQDGRFLADGVTVREIGRGRTLQGFVKEASAIAAGVKYDITHAMLPIPGATIYQPRGGSAPARRDARLRRAIPLIRPWIRLGRLVNAKRRFLALREKTVAADPATRILPGSEMVADEFARYYDRREGVQVVRNGVDIPPAGQEQRHIWRADCRREIQADDEAMVFLTVATNFTLKGVDHAIRAFARWREGTGCDGHFVAIGRKHAAEMQRLAERLDLAGRVHLIGPTSDIHPWYAAADAVVLLSWYDACSRVVLEAVRWSVPAITTVFNGAAEVLADGAGLVVPRPDDVEAICQAMVKLSDPDDRSRRRDACGAIGDELSIARHVDQLMTVYRKCAS